MRRPLPTKRDVVQGHRAAFRRRIHERDDAGLTLIELLVSAILFVTVGTLVTVSLDTFLNVSNVVHTSYANTQQILPVSTNVQRLIRSEVEPAPTLTSTSPPVPPFAVGTVTTTSATFYANVGVPGRPAKVFAGLTNAVTGAPSSIGTTFTVTDILADAGSCPLSVSSTATCTFNPANSKRVASITNVINSTWPSQASPTPVLTYTLLDNAGIQTTVSGNSIATTFTTCTYSTNLVTTCPYDTVQGVEIDLVIRAPGSKLLAPAEDDTIVYRLSSTSFLYSPTVG
jgi:hypothetical protein